MKTYLFQYRGGEIEARVEAESESEALTKVMRESGDVTFTVNAWFTHLDLWELMSDNVTFEAIE